MADLKADWWYWARALLDLFILKARWQVYHLNVIDCFHTLSVA